MPLARDDRLGPYEIAGLIGAGGMGEVYRARDPRLGRDVAIKVLPEEVAEDPARLRRFEREARSIARLDHPNLLAIHDLGHHEGSPYLVCELLEGRTLRERLEAGPIPPQEALALAAQIADGLAAAHSQGIVHRDLKPANVFVTQQDRVKILDFGLAKLVPAGEEDDTELPTATALSQEGMVLGTAHYMAPEQAAGRAVDHRADQFALGVILYEMVAGRRPFEGTTAQETLASILRDDPEPLERAAPRVPVPVRWLVDRCLARDPGGRYEATQDLARDLHTLEARLPELSGAVATPPEAPSRRGSLLGVAAAAVALLVASSALVAFLLGRRATEPSEEVSYRQITYRRGTVTSALFDPSGDSVVYSAAWEGTPGRIHLDRPEAPDPIVVGPAGSRLLSISPRGELLLLNDLFALGPFFTAGELARMPVTGAPRPVAASIAEAVFGPDGDLAALVREAEGQAVLEFPVGTPRLTAEGYIVNLALSPDGRRLAFAETPERGHEWGPILVLDRDGGKRRLEPHAGRGLAWSASGEELWFVVRGEPNRIDAVTPGGERRRVAAFPTEVFLFDVARDGRVLLAAEQRRFEMRGRAAGGQERDLSWLSWSVPFALTDDGETILFNECPGAGPPCSVALRGFGEETPIVLDRNGFGMELSPDGAWALSIPPWSPQELVLIATASEERRRFELERLERATTPAWSPGGDSVYFLGNALGEGDRVYRLDLESGEAMPVTPEGLAFGFFAISPDGARLAARRAVRDIAIYPLEGGEPALLELDQQPTEWSADGRSLYTTTPIGVAPSFLYRVDLSDGSAEPITTLMPPDPAGVVQVSPVRITPDGEAYVYGYLRRLSELFVVEGLQ